jgi:phosphonate transport system substrate-binding protein
MRKDIAEPLKTKIKTFFYNYGKNSAHEREVIMKISKLSGFKASTNAQLIPIRQLELFSAKTKIEADAAISDADKKTRIAEIEKKLAELK